MFYDQLYKRQASLVPLHDQLLTIQASLMCNGSWLRVEELERDAQTIKFGEGSTQKIRAVSWSERWE